MNTEVILKAINEIVHTEIFRQCTVVATAMVGSGVVFGYKKFIDGKKKCRKFLTITDLKVKSKKHSEMNYGKARIRGHI